MDTKELGMMDETQRSNAYSRSRALFENQLSLFKDAKYFNTVLLPESNWYYTRKGYDDLSSMIFDFLSTALNRMIYVYGGNGVGKTATVKLAVDNAVKVVDEMREEKDIAENSNIEKITIDCKEKSTSYDIMRTIIGETKQISSKTVKKYFDDLMEESPSYKIIILDDVQMLKDDHFLYYTSRMESKIMVIATSKYQPTLLEDKLSTHTKSSLKLIKVKFDNYNVPDLVEILTMRANLGLKKYSPKMIELLSAIVARHGNGDARVAIKMLEDVARNDNYDEWVENITGDDDNKEIIDSFTEHIFTAVNSIKNEIQAEVFQRLDLTDQTVLYNILKTFNKNGYAWSTMVFNRVNFSSKMPMTRYHFDKVIEKLENYDFLIREGIRVKRSQQLQLKPKLTEEVAKTLIIKFEEE